jgi:hypothetical protein
VVDHYRKRKKGRFCPKFFKFSLKVARIHLKIKIKGGLEGVLARELNEKSKKKELGGMVWGGGGRKRKRGEGRTSFLAIHLLKFHD